MNDEQEPIVITPSVDEISLEAVPHGILIHQGGTHPASIFVPFLCVTNLMTAMANMKNGAERNK